MPERPGGDVARLTRGQQARQGCFEIEGGSSIGWRREECLEKVKGSGAGPLRRCNWTGAGAREPPKEETAGR